MLAILQATPYPLLKHDIGDSMKCPYCRRDDCSKAARPSAANIFQDTEKKLVSHFVAAIATIFGKDTPKRNFNLDFAKAIISVDAASHAPQSIWKHNQGGDELMEIHHADHLVRLQDIYLVTQDLGDPYYNIAKVDLCRK